ncbi:MAG: hypothetical protein ROO73_05115 [Roseivirga sp.]
MTIFLEALLLSLPSNDLHIVEAFLVITLLVGLLASKGIRSIHDYALSGRNFSTPTLVLTYLATGIGGGSLLGDSKEVFQSGVIMCSS